MLSIKNKKRSRDLDISIESFSKNNQTAETFIRNIVDSNLSDKDIQTKYNKSRNINMIKALSTIR